MLLKERMVKLTGKAVLLIMVFLAGLTVVICNCTNDTSLINWIYDWDDALTMADTENKPIMIDFYTEACPACKKLDSDAFSDEQLSDFLNASFICMKSNANESGLHDDYTIPAVPTIVFTTTEGEEIDRIVGPRSPDEFYQFSQSILDQWES